MFWLKGKTTCSKLDNSHPMFVTIDTNNFTLNKETRGNPLNATRANPACGLALLPLSIPSQPSPPYSPTLAPPKTFQLKRVAMEVS